MVETTSPCLLCGLPKPPDDRCPSCGMTAAFGPARPNPFDARAWWLMMGVIAGIFAITLLVVALTN